jgi:hypothetical protein
MENKIYGVSSKQAWWYKTIRSLNYFSYRYWWLILLFFITYVIAWYLLCFRANEFKCNNFEQVNNRINSIEASIDDCCSCKAALQANIQPCNTSEDVSGGTGFFESFHDLGSESGKVTIRYNMLNIPDKMDVYHNDVIVASTNQLVSGTGSISWSYKAQPGEPTFCKIVMTAPQANTSWIYYIGCPQ